jgi:streptomycin 6-kinase
MVTPSWRAWLVVLGDRGVDVAHLLQNYLPSQEGMAHSQFTKMMVIFSVAFVTVLVLKVSGACPVAL